MAFITTVVVLAPPDPVAAATVYSLSDWGSVGMEHVVMPVRLPQGHLALSVDGSFAKASGFLTQGDRAQVFGQQARIHWTPWSPLDVALGFSAYNLVDSEIPGTGFRSIGTPSIYLKWSDRVRASTLLGASLEITMPAGGTGIVPVDGAFALLFLAGWQPFAPASIALNIGYVYDRARYLFGVPQSIAQRFASQMTLTDRVIGRIGGAWQVDTDAGVFGPLLEILAEIGVGQHSPGNMPVTLTVGGKWIPPRLPEVNVSAGVDIRLTGAPSQNGLFAGKPPWSAYARLTLATNVSRTTAPSPAVAPTAPTCPEPPATSTTPSLLGAQQAVPVGGAPSTVLRGKLRDKRGRLVGEASVKIEHAQDANVVFDRATSEFITSPFACPSDGKVRVTVSTPEFRDEVYDVGCAELQKDPNYALDVRYARIPRPTSLTCYVTDSESGRPIANATLFVPGRTAQPMVAKSNGVIELRDTKPGGAFLIIRAPGYVTQKRPVTLDVGASIIINADLRRRHAARD